MAVKKKGSAGKNSRPRARSGLGKGLGALIGEDQNVVGSSAAAEDKDAVRSSAAAEDKDDAGGKGGQAVLMLPASDIRRGPWQPRHTFGDESLADLAASIRAHGVLQPLMCRRLPDGGVELVAGERRLRAAIACGIERVPVVLREVADRESAEIALVENLQREDLNPIEEAEGYRALMDQFSLGQQEVSERVGKARATVANALRLLELPGEVRDMVGDGRLSSGQAKVLLGLDQETERIMLARRCVAEGVTVRALENMVRRRSESRAAARPPRLDFPPQHGAALTERLRRFFGTGIRLAPSATRANGRRVKGMLEIDFYDNDDLDRILSLIGVSIDDDG